MTAVALTALPQFFDNSGNPLSAGEVNFYQAGTLIRLDTYTDRNAGTPNANPIVLDAAGRTAGIWLQVNQPYKIIVTASGGGTPLSSVDNFYAGADPAQISTAGLVPSTGGTYTGLVSFTGGATFDGTAAQDLATLNSLGIAGAQSRNIFINSDLAIAQRTPGSTADGVYGFDQIVNLTQTAVSTLSQLLQPTDGIAYAMRINQTNGAAQRIGFTQIVEARNCVFYRGKQMVFSLMVRPSVATTIRAALVAWTGAQDAPTRDVVNNWTSTNYTAGNFFIASTATIATVGAACLANAWTELTVSSASPGGVVVPSTMNNLYLVVWSDSTLAQNVTLDVGVAHAGLGTSKPLWASPDFASEYQKCLRYYQTLVVGFTGPTTVGNNYGAAQTISPMRVTPTIVVQGDQAATNFGAPGTLSISAPYANGISFLRPATATALSQYVTLCSASAEF